MAASLVHTAASQTVTYICITELVLFHSDHKAGLSAHLPSVQDAKVCNSPKAFIDTCNLCRYEGMCGVQATHDSLASGRGDLRQTKVTSTTPLTDVAQVVSLLSPAKSAGHLA